MRNNSIAGKFGGDLNLAVWQIVRILPDVHPSQTSTVNAQTAKFKFCQYQNSAIPPNLIPAKFFRYAVCIVPWAFTKHTQIQVTGR